MRISEITICFTETCNLGDYSNTKPSVELKAVLEPGDDVGAVVAQLTRTAKSVIHDKIDEELELASKPVKYFQGVRYDVIYASRTGIVAIVPMGSVRQLDGGFYHAARGIRYAAAVRVAEQQLDQMPSPSRCFDCNILPLSDLTEYATAQNQAYEEREAERRRQRDEDQRRSRAEWEAKQTDFDEEDEE